MIAPDSYCRFEVSSTLRSSVTHEVTSQEPHHPPHSIDSEKREERGDDEGHHFTQQHMI